MLSVEYSTVSKQIASIGILQSSSGKDPEWQTESSKS